MRFQVQRLVVRADVLTGRSAGKPCLMAFSTSGVVYAMVKDTSKGEDRKYPRLHRVPVRIQSTAGRILP